MIITSDAILPERVLYRIQVPTSYINLAVDRMWSDEMRIYCCLNYVRNGILREVIGNI